MFVKDPLCSIVVHYFLNDCRLVKYVLYFSHMSFQSSPCVIYNVLFNGYNGLKSVKCDLAKE